MTSPCGKIRIPINESTDDKSQIQEYLSAYHGEGIQHIALGTGDIYETVETLKPEGVPFQTVPDTYYEQVDSRLPGHGEDLKRLAGRPHPDRRRADQGRRPAAADLHPDRDRPIFFEIIQRRGNEGFGEGNFRALFESIELDQIRRGVLKA
jgi:4-hydroxyphenylpyruvate dioxygenase